MKDWMRRLCANIWFDHYGLWGPRHGGNYETCRHWLCRFSNWLEKRFGLPESLEEN